VKENLLKFDGTPLFPERINLVAAGIEGIDLERPQRRGLGTAAHRRRVGGEMTGTIRIRGIEGFREQLVFGVCNGGRLGISSCHFLREAPALYAGGRN
jgi:hypothetical protein